MINGENAKKHFNLVTVFYLLELQVYNILSNVGVCIYFKAVLMWPFTKARAPPGGQTETQVSLSHIFVVASLRNDATVGVTNLAVHMCTMHQINMNHV